MRSKDQCSRRTVHPGEQGQWDLCLSSQSQTVQKLQKENFYSLLHEFLLLRHEPIISFASHFLYVYGQLPWKTATVCVLVFAIFRNKDLVAADLPSYIIWLDRPILGSFSVPVNTFGAAVAVLLIHSIKRDMIEFLIHLSKVKYIPFVQNCLSCKCHVLFYINDPIILYIESKREAWHSKVEQKSKNQFHCFSTVMKNVAQILAFSRQNEIPGGRVQGFTLARESQGAVVMQVSVSGRETLRPVPVC